MRHKIKNTNNKHITEDAHIEKIKHMVTSGYVSTLIDGKKVSVVSSEIVNVNNRTELLTIVRVEG